MGIVYRSPGIHRANSEDADQATDVQSEQRLHCLRMTYYLFCCGSMDFFFLVMNVFSRKVVKNVVIK